MTTDAVTATLDGDVAVVEMHRPPNNYFDLDALTLLADHLERLGGDPACRAVVVCTEGKNFCAGADLSGSDVIDHTTRLYAQAARIAGCAVPTIAAVQGAAVGGGLGLALAATFRVATPETRFSCNFARLGFHQGFGISVTLPAVVGQQRALELMYTGGSVKGEAALAIGLADRLVPADDLRAAAHELATEIATSAPLAVRAIHETMRGSLAAEILAATEREAEQQQILRRTDDFAEGVRAMAERRTPNFTGR
jgi:2-(1,2-epoxy-1,2-dihydrophenyl)acetyl-CoA isomerase